MITGIKCEKGVRKEQEPSYIQIGIECGHEDYLK